MSPEFVIVVITSVNEALFCTVFVCLFIH